MNPLEQLKNQYPQMTKSEQNIADYILNCPQGVIRYSLTDLAKHSHSSNTAIIRLCQKLGYQGFSEFKFSMSRAALSTFPTPAEKNNLQSIVSQYTQFLGRMAAETDKNEIAKIAALLTEAKTITIMGANRTGFSASQFSYRLAKLGIASHAITDQIVISDFTEILGPGDVCVIFSITTATYNYLEAARRLRQRNCAVILITMNPATPLKRHVTSLICLPRISTSTDMGFLDDQALFFVFIEVLLSEISSALTEKSSKKRT